MSLQSPTDAMPWMGLYVAVASLICTLAMAADAFQGFRQRKLWFPCRFFTINSASITLIAIAMKLPVDLTTDEPNDQIAKVFGIYFLFTMLANCLPSLGLMDDKELLVNIIALGILIITLTVNVFIQSVADQVQLLPQGVMLVYIFLLHWPFSIALIVPASRRVLENQYQDLHRSSLNHQEIKFSSKELLHHVKKYWMMAETGNPQFVLACSPFCSASGVLCPFIAFLSSLYLYNNFDEVFDFSSYGKSDYKWSISVIIMIQSIGIIVSSIAPTFRCITSISYFSLSKEWSINNLNMFRVEKYWTQRLQQWKRSQVPSHIPGHHCKKVFHIVKNMILNCCLALQITAVVICKTICLIPRSFLILFSWCSYLCKSLLKRFKKESNASNNNVRSEIETYTGYVLQIEEAKLSKRILKNALSSINRILCESEEKQPINLMKFLEKSTGFYGVVEFDNDLVPPLHSEETHNCWSLVVVTLTAIVIALPNIENDHVKGLLASMSEGLQFVRHIEECLNANGDLVKPRKTARRLWTEVEVFYSWLQIDLQKKARKGKMSKEILQWLGDEAVKTVIQFKRRKTRSLDHSLHRFIAASSMYRISQTILLHCNEQEDWPTDEELFEWISTIITDLLCACFTNLPRVITMKCHHKSIEKRGESIRSAAQLLGKSKTILEILEARQLPNIDMDSMSYIDKWHELLKSQIPTGRASSARIQPASTSSSSDESLIVTIM